MQKVENLYFDMKKKSIHFIHKTVNWYGLQSHINLFIDFQIFGFFLKTMRPNPIFKKISTFGKFGPPLWFSRREQELYKEYSPLIFLCKNFLFLNATQVTQLVIQPGLIHFPGPGVGSNFVNILVLLPYLEFFSF